MTAFQKPTQEQEGQESRDSQARGELHRHVTPAGERYQGPPGSGAAPATSRPPINNGASPALDDLPTGTLPAAPQMPNPGKVSNPASMSGIAPQTPLPGSNGQSGNGNNGSRNPASFSGIKSGLPSMSGIPNTPSIAEMLPTPNTPGVPNRPSMAGIPGQGFVPQTPPQPDMRGQQPDAPDTTMQPPAQKEAEIEDGNLILYRSPTFYVRTTNRIGRRVDPLRKPSGHTTVMPKVMPNQDKRMAASDTRLMPSVKPINPMKQKRFPFPVWLEVAIVVGALAVAIVAHAFNMFNFPRYELDEGTYMSSAWAILHGLITPYAYGYGHPPLGWIQLAGMVQALGSFFAFGNALNTGRVLMLFYAAGSALLVYLIARRLGASRVTGLLALVIFSLSPLGITYQRQVFLDNIATFWLLLSLFFLVVGNSRLLFIVLGALSLGVAMLSKEVLIVVTPVMVYALWLHTTTFQRKFAIVAFTYVFVAVGSSFILLAVLKGELFPRGWLPWDNHEHLSLIGTYAQQGARGQGEGSVATAWNTWMQGDKLLMILSIAAPAFNLAVGWWYRKQLLLALLSISLWVLLVRGGVVLPFYIIPLIPLTALNAAMALNTILTWLVKVVRFDIVRVALILGAIAVIIPYNISGSANLFTLHPTKAQTDALAWVRANVQRNSFMVINSYLYMDLRQPGGAGDGDTATFPHAEVYDNIGGDPTIYNTELQNNWDRIDYIVADSEMLTNIKSYHGQGYDLIKQALEPAHSVLVATFADDDQGKICPKPVGQTCAPDELKEQQLVITVYQVIHKVSLPTV